MITVLDFLYEHGEGILKWMILTVFLSAFNSSYPLRANASARILPAKAATGPER